MPGLWVSCCLCNPELGTLEFLYFEIDVRTVCSDLTNLCGCSATVKGCSQPCGQDEQLPKVAGERTAQVGQRNVPMHESILWGTISLQLTTCITISLFESLLIQCVFSFKSPARLYTTLLIPTSEPHTVAVGARPGEVSFPQSGARCPNNSIVSSWLRHLSVTGDDPNFYISQTA